VEIRHLDEGASALIDVADVKPALAADDNLIWVDLPCEDPETARVLSEVFQFDRRAVADCLQRNPVAKLHMYDDHAFLVLHVPDPGEHGHVHSIEMKLFIGPNYVVTVHGPLNPDVDPKVALVETGAVSRRIDTDRWRPRNADELVHAIITGMNRRMNAHLSELRYITWDLERRVTSGELGNPEDFLEEMFGVRLGLQAIRTMAALDREVYSRMNILRKVDAAGHALMSDTVDQFERVMASADVQRDYLQGVIDFYQTRINTKMTLAAERLAVIAAVTLPVTAVSSVLGMNVIVSDHTHWEILIFLIIAMGSMSTWLLIWARRQGWW
jgi:Mg2+ and Co2+ transporter CorA